MTRVIFSVFPTEINEKITMTKAALRIISHLIFKIQLRRTIRSFPQSDLLTRENFTCTTRFQSQCHSPLEKGWKIPCDVNHYV